jgi:simple sugar transport system ATP-binding protein
MQITVDNLTKSFGALRANDGVSLRFAGGQIHGVLGENGAGKSTLMKLLSGFLRPDSGAIELDGKAIELGDPGAALRAGVGMVHQEPLDLPGFSALENLLCAAPRWALPTRAEARATLTILAGKLGFSVAPDDPVAALTVGQRQQLEIIRLLACGARALILDEPTTGITAAQARALFAALRQLAADGNTVLFVSHKLDEVAALCDTVSVLRAGRLVGAGQMAMPQPQERLIELMFGAGVGAAPAGAAGRPEAAAGRAPAWQLQSVSVREGGAALRNLSLRIPGGAVVGLAGIEGGGQQPLLRLLCGQLPPDAGRVLLGGADLSGAGMAAFRRGGVEYLPADRLAAGLVGPLTLAEHFALLQPSGPLVNRRAAEAAARAAIAGYAIKATPASPIAALSGGNQQRAMLALVPDDVRALVCEQPTRGLDVASARAVWARLLARRDAGCAVVFAAADLDEILDYSDYVLVFFAGRVSRLLLRAELSAPRLAELIGGVGFAAVEAQPEAADR